MIEVEENAHFYRNASFAAYHQGLANEALVILDRGKTLLLREALRLKMKKPEWIPKEEWMKYELVAEKYRNATTSTGREEDYAKREENIQNSLKEMDVAIKLLQSYDPEFQKELDVSDILSILDEETAILTFCITDKGSIGFVVSRSNGVKAVEISNFKTEDLNSLLFKPYDYGIRTGGWVTDYLSYQNASATYSQLYEDFSNEHGKKGTSRSEGQLMEAYNRYEYTSQSWQMTLNNVLSSIASKLFTPLLAELPPKIKNLFILPSGGLFLLPLHAVPLSDGQPLCQRYCVCYAPSIELLIEMHNKVRKVEGKRLYAVINPQEDPSLVFSRCEGQSISKLFQSSLLEVGKICTKLTVLDRIPGREYIHFSCHGIYKWNEPSQSGLYLVGGKTLSLADLQNDIVDMSSARLVTLSACETGISDVIHNRADEFVGLPAGFIIAGIPCVVSSLWSVPDISTALLMERFYSNHITKGMDIPLALQESQLWVRDLTYSQVTNYVENCYRLGKWEGESKDLIEKYRERYTKMAEESPEKKPFQHPYYWAAFTLNGV